MGYTNFADLKADSALAHKQRIIPFHKTVPTAGAGVGSTLWASTGLPGAGAQPSLGSGGAVTCNKLTTGAMWFDDAPTGQSNYLWKILLGTNQTSSALGGLVMIVDRLAHAKISIAVASGSFSPVIDGTSRLDSGEGGMIIMEVTTALSSSGTGIRLIYTNEAGVTDRTTAEIFTISSAVVGRAPYANFMWVPLQAGDRGVRQITGWTLNPASTGEINIVLCKPLLMIPLPYANSMTEREFSIQVQGMTRLHNDACLCMLYYAQSTTAPLLNGNIRLLTR